MHVLKTIKMHTFIILTLLTKSILNMHIQNINFVQKDIQNAYSHLYIILIKRNSKWSFPPKDDYPYIIHKKGLG